MSWIRTIDRDAAQGRLRTLYERVQGVGGRIDNIMKVHALRPHTLDGHMSLYRSVLHHQGNRLPREWLETLGVYVSHLNRCSYCVEHHFAGLRKLLDDDVRAHQIREALESGELAVAFDEREQAMLRYARELTRQPPSVVQAQVEALREAGLDDGEILEVNQVVAYFAYANRTALGLGVTTAGEALGLTAVDTAVDWRHC
jgi:uncharacterized peroxidase-related enzyme